MSLQLLTIPLGDISPSPSNPRRAFDEAYLAELADDIRARGVLSPVLVRPHPVGGYELVFGECRWRAAKLAELAEIPAMVRELTDAEVLEIQVVENAKRRDVHPLEEADAYRALHESHGYAIDDIAAKLGKSKSYVYGRLRLCGLGAVAREAFFAGEIKPAVALMLTRLEDLDVQAKAVEEAVRLSSWPVGELWESIQRTFLHRLDQAPFDTEDARIVEGAGACTSCPYRTAAQQDLFDDAVKNDRCTKPSCWQAKSDAAWLQQKREVRKAGGRILPDEERKKVIPYGEVAWSAPYVELNAERRIGDEFKTWREILDGTEYEVTLARSDSGKIFELVSKEAAEAALAKLDVSPKPKSPEQERKEAEWEAKRAKEAAERKAVVEARNAKVADLVERIEKAGPCAAVLRAIVKCNAFYYGDEAKRRRGLDAEGVFAGELLVMNAAELTGLIAEISIESAEDVALEEDEDPFEVFEAALEAAPKGKRNLKKREVSA